MKTKSRSGGKPKRSFDTTTTPKNPLSVPVRALPVLFNSDELSIDDQMMPGISPREVHDELLDIDWLEKRTCIQCDESDNLLVCSETGCPIALHEKCMPCRPIFDNEGNFYCPYCSYKRSLTRARELRKKAVMAKKALSNFNNSCVVGDDTLDQAQPRTAVDDECQPNPSAANVTNSTNNQLEGIITCIVLDKVSVSKGISVETGVYEKQPFLNVENRPGIQEGDLRSTEQDHHEGIVEDQREGEMLSACQAEEETVIDDATHAAKGAERSEKLSEETAIASENIEQMKPNEPDNELEVHENTNVGSETNDLNVDTRFVRKTRVKTRAHKTAKKLNNGSVRKSPLEMPEKRTAIARENIEQMMPNEADNELEVHENTYVDSETNDLDVETHSVLETLVKLRAHKTTKKINAGLSRKSPRKTPEKMAASQIDEVRPGLLRKSPRKTQEKMAASQIEEVHPGLLRKSPRKTPEMMAASQIGEVRPSRKLKRPQQSTKQSMALPYPDAKRVRVFWTAEEEEMLREGLQKYSTEKKIPWLKILEFGRHTFHASRTADMLRDKWRSLVAKESL